MQRFGAASRLELVTKDAWVPEAVRRWNPKSHLGRYVREVVLAYLPKEAQEELIGRIAQTVVCESSLSARIYRGAVWLDGLWRVDLGARLVEDCGLLSTRLVTNAGVGYLVDALQNIVEPESLKFHGLGTGTNAENQTDTALQTELSTAYNPDSTRATGSTTEASANVFRSVGTNTLDATAAVTEHGLFTQAATGGGVLLDRSVFGALNLGNGDSVQTTYDWTLSAGG